MSTEEKGRKVHEARARLDELREEARKATIEYQTWLGEIIDAVDGQDEEEVSHAFDKAFAAGARLRDIIEDDVSVLLDVLAPPHDEPSPDDAIKPSQEVVTGEEIQKLILALGRGQATFTDQDAETLVDWAKQARTNADILDLLLAGKITASIGPDGGVQFAAAKVLS